MNTFQLIQIAMTVVFAVSATVVGVQAARYARQARIDAARAESALRAIATLTATDQHDEELQA